jgi:hypothetical protein
MFLRQDTSFVFFAFTPLDTSYDMSHLGLVRLFSFHVDRKGLRWIEVDFDLLWI